MTEQREATSLIVIAAVIAREQERWLRGATSGQRAPACALRSALAGITARNMSPFSI